MGITKERTQIQVLCSIGRGKVSERLKEQRLFSAYFTRLLGLVQRNSLAIDS